MAVSYTHLDVYKRQGYGVTKLPRYKIFNEEQGKILDHCLQLEENGKENPNKINDDKTVATRTPYDISLQQPPTSNCLHGRVPELSTNE